MGWLIGRVLFAVRPRERAVGDHPSGTTVAGRLVQSTRGSWAGRPFRAGPPAVTVGPFLTLLQVGFTEPRRSPAVLVVSCTTVSPLPLPRAAVCFLWHCPAGCPGWVLPTTLPCGARTFLDSRPEGREPRSPGQPIRETRIGPARRRSCRTPVPRPRSP